MTLGRSVTIWVVAAASMLLGASRGPTYVGVLEPPRPQSQRFHVRVAFRFADGRWSAMPHEAADEDGLARLTAIYPAQMSWTIALHGKKLGEVSSVRPANYASYAQVGLEDLTAGSITPEIAEVAAAFETWMGTSRYRPLLAVSEPNYHDPDGWATFDVAPAMRKQAIAAFRGEIALDLNCDGKTTRNYPDSAIQVVGKPYRSRRGDVLIAMRPDPLLNRCDGSAGEEWQSVWFHLKDDQLRWIGNSLTILEIGDYGGAGSAEVLFHYDGYDRDGYVLFDPRADSITEFSWSYH
jgi:hypothetical protein